jgi:transposase
MRARHRVSKLLLRQGIVYYGGNALTRTHLVWLRRQRFDAPGLQLAFDAEREAVLQAEARRDRLDKAIEAMAADSTGGVQPGGPPPGVPALGSGR